MLVPQMLRSGALLALFALLGTALLAVTYDNTEERIAEQQRQRTLRTLHALVPDALYNNEIINDVVYIQAPAYFGTADAVTVYRARKNEQAVAAVFNVVAPDGYSGNIYLLVAIADDGRILGVRVVQHRETPGLGDGIEVERNPWILAFDQRSLDSPAADGWAVKRDGGVFDQLTGATITPRAVVKAVHKCLQYFGTHRGVVFSTPSGNTIEETGNL